MGRATTLLFAQEDANVVVADLNAEEGRKVAALGAETGNACVYILLKMSGDIINWPLCYASIEISPVAVGQVLSRRWSTLI